MYQLAPGQQLYVSPEDDTIGSFLRLLSDAKTSIHLADYSYNIDTATKILIDKHNAGLDVK